MSNSALERAHNQEFNERGVTDNTNRPKGILSKTTQNGEQLAELKVTPIPFESTVGAKLITTLDLGLIINSVFKKVFRDYDGCTLVYDQGAFRWKAALYFRENVNVGTEGAVANIVPVGSVNKNSNTRLTTSERISNMNRINANVHYSLTKETTDVLGKYLLPYEKGKKEINWGARTSEQREKQSMYYNNSAIYVVVHGIDVIELLKEIYGRENEEGHLVDYNISSVRSIPQFQSDIVNMLLSVQRLDMKMVEELYTKLGAIPSAFGRLPIIR